MRLPTAIHGFIDVGLLTCDFLLRITDVQLPTWDYLHAIKVMVKSSMAKSLPVENLLPQNAGSIINYLR